MYTPLTRSRMTLTAEETNQLASHLTTNPTVRLRLIEGNRPLVIYAVHCLLRKWPTLKRVQDDLLGAGFVGLVEAVNDLTTRTDIKNPAAYIGIILGGHIFNEAREYRAWKVSKQYALATTPEEILAIENEGLEEVDIQDMLAACCVMPHTREVADLRRQGCTLEEIASRLKISNKTVQQKILAIKSKLDCELQKNSV